MLNTTKVRLNDWQKKVLKLVVKFPGLTARDLARKENPKLPEKKKLEYFGYHYLTGRAMLFGQTGRQLEEFGLVERREHIRERGTWLNGKPRNPYRSQLWEYWPTNFGRQYLKICAR